VRLAVDGFASGSDAYERGRPGYPDGLLTELARRQPLHAGSRVADLAAGTGKLSRQLRATGAWCVAVEPSASMRAECHRVAPGVAIVAGSAERLPFAAHSVDLVTVAQAFHWFSPAVALHESARVLRPGGTLALIWNERQESAPWITALNTLLRGVGQAPYQGADQHRPMFERDPHFGPFAGWSAAFETQMWASDVVDMVGSRSYVRVLDAPARAEVLSRVQDLVAPLPQPFPMPYVSYAYCAETIPGPCRCAATTTAQPEETRWSD
jgi:SAM-dependent methyltransferase